MALEGGSADDDELSGHGGARSGGPRSARAHRQLAKAVTHSRAAEDLPRAQHASGGGPRRLAHKLHVTDEDHIVLVGRVTHAEDGLAARDARVRQLLEDGAKARAASALLLGAIMMGWCCRRG